LGNRLGAVDLPDTALDTDQAIAAYVPELHFGERARAIVTLLDEYPSSLHSRPFVRLVSKAVFSIYPTGRIHSSAAKSRPRLNEALFNLPLT
jgi:hypothetical protein